MTEPLIIDRGRGPEIKGTRITVYDVMDYWLDGWRCEQMAAMFRLTPQEIQAAIDYIEEHRAEVQAEYDQILERHRNYEYPPEVKEKLKRSHERFQQRLAAHRACRSREPDAV